jgi:hypothetical protein
MGQGDVEEETLHDDHYKGLDEKGGVVARDDPVEDSVDFVVSVWTTLAHSVRSYFRIEARSIIRGMSREKPADVRVR